MKTVRTTLVALAAAGLMLQGCVAAVVGAGAGAGTYAYVRGEYQATYPRSLVSTYTATVKALNDLDMPVLNSSKDLTDGVIESKKGDGSAVKIILKSAGNNITTVKIRVGIFGDEASSRLIEGKISARLGV